MQLSNSFTIARPVSEVYDAFLDVDRIATCMPGSTLLGQSGEDTYDGEVKVKVGPLSVTYTGQFTILERDPDTHTLTMRAKGREKRGAGNADAHIVATLSEEAGVTSVHLATELNVRGKVAQFGRGVIADVTDSIMQTFAGNVEQMLVSGGTVAPARAEAPTPPPAATPATGTSAAQPSGQAAAAGEPAPAPAAGTGRAPAAGEPAGTGAMTSEGLDAWALIVKPMLQRHAGSIATIALSGLAAYLGARRGARAGRHGGPAGPLPAGRFGPPLRYYY